MSVDEFCRWARIGRTKAYAEAKAGRLLLRKIGAKTVIRTEDAQAWLAALPLAASEA
ncbi:MAG: DNA-binding protein [Rhizobiales bacterium]|nr:DNA-binding protein [Hyphomicrobiales bacterium]